MKLSRGTAQLLIAELVNLDLTGTHRTLDMASFLFGTYSAEEERRFLAPVVVQAECDWNMTCPDGTTVTHDDDHWEAAIIRLIDDGSMNGGRALRLVDVHLSRTNSLEFLFGNGCKLRLEVQDESVDAWFVHRSTGTRIQFFEGEL